jgi:uncharacterized YigZ family protein
MKVQRDLLESFMPPQDHYQTIAAPVRAPEVKVLGSRFIADIVPIVTKEAIDEHLERIRKEFYDATHHCYAFVLGERGDHVRAADDGEPGGTAGKPILTVLQGAKLTNVLCVVTRYFGGTKLGMGGLVRAYTEAAQEAVACAKIVSVLLTEAVQLTYGYDDTSIVERIMQEYETRAEDTVYGDEAKVVVKIRRSLVEKFKAEVIERSNARIKVADQ